MKNSSMSSLISGVLFTIAGIIIFIHPEVVVKFISYFFGGLLIAIGAYKILVAYFAEKNNSIVNKNDMVFGVISIILGLLFIFLAGTIEFLIRFMIGIWFILAGLSKLSVTFNTKDRTKKFYSLLVISFIYIIIGLYIILVSNLALSVIGILMALYGITDVVSAFVHKDLFKEKEEKKENKKQKALPVMEAEVEEKE